MTTAPTATYTDSLGLPLRVPEELTYCRREVQLVDSEQPTLLREMVGDWYVALCENESGKTYWKLSQTPFRTNMSRETRLHGWLGCSYGVDEYARGKVRCTVRNGRPAFRRISDD